MIFSGPSEDIDVNGAFSGENGKVVRNQQQCGIWRTNILQQVVNLNWLKHLLPYNVYC